MKEPAIIKKIFNGVVIYLYDTKFGIHGKLRNAQDGTREREPAFMSVFKRELKPGMLLVDIGANIGYHSLWAASVVGKDGAVIAFEPDSRNFKLLVMGVEGNAFTNVEVYAMAVSDKVAGKQPFYLAKASNLSSMQQSARTTEQIFVDTTTLSNFFLGRVKPPDFVKMDIEGHEVEVLRGARAMFSEYFQCKLLIEVHPQFLNGKDFEEELRYLLEKGFTTKYVITAGVARPDAFVEHGYEPDEVFDCGRFERGLYTGVSNEDMLAFACYPIKQEVPSAGEVSPKIVRAVMLERSVTGGGSQVDDPPDEDTSESAPPNEIIIETHAEGAMKHTKKKRPPKQRKRDSKTLDRPPVDRSMHSDDSKSVVKK